MQTMEDYEPTLTVYAFEKVNDGGGFALTLLYFCDALPKLEQHAPAALGGPSMEVQVVLVLLAWHLQRVVQGMR